MRFCVRLSSLSLCLILSTFLLAAGDVKKPDPKKPDPAKVAPNDPKKVDPKMKDEPPKVAPKEKFVYSYTFTGKLKMDAKGEMTLVVTLKNQVPDLEAQRQILQRQQDKVRRDQDFQRRYLDAMRNQNFQERQRAIAQLQQDIQKANYDAAVAKPINPLKTVETTRDIPFRTADKVIVRTGLPPLEYDDKGNAKNYTQKELFTLAGNEGYPGFPSDADSLRSDQLLQIFFAKNALVPKGPMKMEPKVDKDGVPLPVVDEQRPEVILVLVLQEKATK